MDAYTSDRWLRWLQEGRSGGDAALKAMQLAQLAPVRDRVLRYARINDGDTLLDVGCGDGLIGFAALDHVGPTGHVIFTDISAPALAQCRSAAGEMGVAARCSFVETPADSLAAIGDGSADVVTTRSVLIYVKDKAAAFCAFHRVLRPGGRVSIFEPINRSDRASGPDLLWGIDVAPVAGLAARVRAVFDKAVPSDSAMLDFDERDLVAGAEAAGFSEIDLRLEAHVARRREPLPGGVKWEALVNMAPNPLAPSLAEAMREALDPDERVRLEGHLRREFESGRVRQRSAVAYLQAVRD